MVKGSKSGCKSASHQLFKDKAKNRVDDLQGMFMDLQFARKESRTSDINVLEEQVHQMLREWKEELSEPSPASSLHGGSLSFTSDICRLLQNCEEEDDATSSLAASANPKTKPDVQNLQTQDTMVFQQDYFVNQAPQECATQGIECKGSPSGVQTTLINNLDVANPLDFQQFDLQQYFDHSFYIGFNGNNGHCGDAMHHHMSGFLPTTCLPPSAFLGPKCALWDCPRPAQGSDWYQYYCSSFHAVLALNEGPLGMTPVLRPGGIGLKDGLLFAALSPKTQGKDVGIPECEGAAMTKSPWNVPGCACTHRAWSCV